MPRENYNLSTPGFVGDHQSIDLMPGGAQIGWDEVVADAAGNKTLPAGKIMSRRAADNLMVPRADLVGNAAVAILATNASEEASRTGHHAKSGYGFIVGGVIHDTLLPDSGHADFGTMKTELKAAGTGFVFEPYSDDRAS